MRNDYLNNINRQIAEASRFVKDYRSDPSKYGSATHSSRDLAQSDQMAQMMQMQQQMQAQFQEMFQSMMITMMELMLGRSVSGTPTTSASDMSTDDPFDSFPDYRPLPNGSTETSSSGGADVPETPNTLDTQVALELLESYLSAESPNLQSFLNAWEQKNLSEKLLGQSLMYMLDQGSDEKLETLLPSLSSLVGNRVLNPLPFVSEDYLAKLTPERRLALSQALTQNGLNDASGKSDARLFSFVLNQLQPQANTTGSLQNEMARQLLSALYARKSNPIDPQLLTLMRLLGFQFDEQGQVTGEQPISLV